MAQCIPTSRRLRRFLLLIPTAFKVEDDPIPISIPLRAIINVACLVHIASIKASWYENCNNRLCHGCCQTAILLCILPTGPASDGYLQFRRFAPQSVDNWQDIRWHRAHVIKMMTIIIIQIVNLVPSKL